MNLPGIILASLPSFCQKLSKIGRNLTKFCQKQICTVFLRHDVVTLAVSRSTVLELRRPIVKTSPVF